MKKLYIVILLIFHVCVFSQNTTKMYTLHLSGEAQDTLVYEMEWNNDGTFVNRKYSKKVADTTSNYKKWKVDIRKGTYTKEKGYYRLSQNNGDQCLNGSLIRIVFGQIWFYYVRDKDQKIKRCNALTYHRASL